MKAFPLIVKCSSFGAGVSSVQAPYGILARPETALYAVNVGPLPYKMARLSILIPKSKLEHNFWLPHPKSTQKTPEIWSFVLKSSIAIFSKTAGHKFHCKAWLQGRDRPSLAGTNFAYMQLQSWTAPLSICTSRSWFIHIHFQLCQSCQATAHILYITATIWGLPVQLMNEQADGAMDDICYLSTEPGALTSWPPCWVYCIRGHDGQDFLPFTPLTQYSWLWLVDKVWGHKENPGTHDLTCLSCTSPFDRP